MLDPTHQRPLWRGLTATGTWGPWSNVRVCIVFVLCIGLSTSDHLTLHVSAYPSHLPRAMGVHGHSPDSVRLVCIH